MSTPPPPPGKPETKARPLWRNWWFWVIVVLAVLLIGSLAGGDTPEEAGAPSVSPEPIQEPSEPTEEPTQAPTPEPSPEGRTFGDGTWVVGEDIKPGSYRNSDASDFCYWERMKNFSGGLNSIIANGNAIDGPIVVEIQRSDEGFTSQDCGEWTTDLSRVSESKTRLGNGMWIVGVDIAPGTYRSTDPGGACYWERMRDFKHSLNSILANDLPSGGSAIVEINGGDAGFTSQDCGTWTKV